MLELPMAIKINSGVDAFVSIDTPLGSGKVSVKGPMDKDKDGDPEVEFTVDLPGTVADFTWTAEIPLGTFVGGSIPQIAEKGLEAAPEFPGKGLIISAVGVVVKKVGEMFFGKKGG